jgi:hypothetical protein
VLPPVAIGVLWPAGRGNVGYGANVGSNPYRPLAGSRDGIGRRYIHGIERREDARQFVSGTPVA